MQVSTYIRKSLYTIVFRYIGWLKNVNLKTFKNNVLKLMLPQFILKVINMDFNKKLLSILAIFCIIASAGIVCAADSNGYAGSNYLDNNGFSGSQYYGNYDGGYAGSNYYNNSEPGNGLPLENQTNPYAGNATHDVAGNATGNATGEVTNNTAGNATNGTSHNMLSTGNPILILLAVIAVIGGATVLRRK